MFHYKSFSSNATSTTSKYSSEDKTTNNRPKPRVLSYIWSVGQESYFISQKGIQSPAKNYRIMLVAGLNTTINEKARPTVSTPRRLVQSELATEPSKLQSHKQERDESQTTN